MIRKQQRHSIVQYCYYPSSSSSSSLLVRTMVQQKMISSNALVIVMILVGSMVLIVLQQQSLHASGSYYCYAFVPILNVKHYHPVTASSSKVTTTTITGTGFRNDDTWQGTSISNSNNNIQREYRNLQLFMSTTEKDDVITISKEETTMKQQSLSSSSSQRSFVDRVATGSLVSAAAVAASAVNAAVSMRKLEAPDVTKSYVTVGNDNDNHDNDGSSIVVDDEGLPLRYNKELIELYWSKERGALNKRWSQFISKAVPFFTRLVALFVKDGKIPDSEIPMLARQARLDLQELGPTFIKAGQMMSVRPDVLPNVALEELQKLQDSVKPFDTGVAIQQIEKELGGPLGQFFTSISQEPVAAASLAQVYLATLADGKDTRVAVKIQRPDVLGTVSKDLYVLRRAAEVFDGLVKRFAPQQRTDYVALLNEWAIGFYTELDFANEAQNQKRLRQLLIDNNITDVTVPLVYEKYSSRRILVSQWIDGKKLSDCSDETIGLMTPIAQEAFLTQLFEVGFFHADPHPGNVLVINNPTDFDGAQIALIDCGLMATIDSDDRDYMISAVIHLANKNYPALVDDFINLGILPKDSNRPTIIPLMDKALTPYVMGGGAKRYEEEVRKIYGMDDTTSMSNQVGGFQAMTQDALTVLQDVPFSIPPYFAILGRAIVTLEGVALKGNPNYGIIMESYPFIARKLLKEGRPEIQKALQEVLYSSGDDSTGLKITRLLALLNNAAGQVVTQQGAAFVDLDGLPKDGLTIKDAIKFILSDNAQSLRTLLIKEFDTGIDITTRQLFRRGMSEAVVTITPPKLLPSIPFFGNILPEPSPIDEIPIPIVLPPRTIGTKSTKDNYKFDTNIGSILTTESSRPTVGLLTLKELTDTIAPKLDQTEELYALSLSDAVSELGGNEQISKLLRGEHIVSPATIYLLLGIIRSGALGRSDLLSNNTIQSILKFITDTIQRSTTMTVDRTELATIVASIRSSIPTQLLSFVPITNILDTITTTAAAAGATTRNNNNNNNNKGGVDNDDDVVTVLQGILDELTDAERERWDEIVQTLVSRAIVRSIERLSNVERIL